MVFIGIAVAVAAAAAAAGIVVAMIKVTKFCVQTIYISIEIERRDHTHTQTDDRQREERKQILLLRMQHQNQRAIKVISRRIFNYIFLNHSFVRRPKFHFVEPIRKKRKITFFRIPVRCRYILPTLIHLLSYHTVARIIEFLIPFFSLVPFTVKNGSNFFA